MKAVLALAISLVLLSAVGVAAGEGPDRTDLDAANRALAGRRAVIQLDDGEVIAGARQVALGPELTTWETDGRIRQVDTAEVEQIAVMRRSRVRRWARRGLIAGALFGAVGGGYSEKDGFFLESPDASEIAAGAVAGAAVGAAAGAIAGEKVVYRAD